MKTRVVQDGRLPDSRPNSTAVTAAPRRSFVKRHPMVTFFAITYTVGWAALPFNTFGAYSPMVAAVIVIALTDGRAGFRRLGSRLVRWRVGWRWYGAALALPLGTLAVSSALNIALGAPSPSLSQFSPWYAVLAVFAVNMVFPLGGPLGEEPGWRGYAQPGLQNGRSPLAATTILAVLITIWHMPLLLPAFGLQPIELLSTIAVTFWYSWLFNRSGGSALITLISHSTEGSIETSTLWSGTDTTRLITLWALVACTIAIALVITDWRFWTGKQDESDPNEPPTD
jgi:membrane protease YdiL (CAAX protease family)